MNAATPHRLFALQDPGQIFEALIAGLAAAVLRPGDLAIDAGGQHGCLAWSCALSVGATGRVLAIEAIPDRAATLRLAALAHGMAQVDVIEARLADRGGIAAPHAVVTAEGPGGPRMPVRTLRLYDLLDSRPQPWRFARLDLADGRLLALQGGQAAIARWRPILVLETGPEIAPQAVGSGREDAFALFARLDYRLMDLSGRRVAPAQGTAVPMRRYLAAAPEGSADAAFVARHLSDAAARVAQAAG